MKTSTVLRAAIIALILSLGTNLAWAQHGGGRGGGFHHGMAMGSSWQHPGMPHDHFHGHFIIVGGPFFWYPPYYDPAYYMLYNPGVYVTPDPNYSYYCRDPVGYYPNVQSCPDGWLRLAPGQ
ncbi:hypothetical protein [Glaciimonas soli]|uniref:Uncharacterized protein n=1 Tax=Glaciimonas soli TaxID=2590999 RepID=A0A843YSE0_9BURK|nr:hypothetical protein [Glaciimonas soli]MQR02050.1 hypothetical protein [Glaciimonas soli]